MYNLATMHSVTDRQTDRQHCDANSRSRSYYTCGTVRSTNSNVYRAQCVV